MYNLEIDNWMKFQLSPFDICYVKVSLVFLVAASYGH